ncbi:MAG: PIG-L deacetylase family protein [Pseudomonadota bacterium]
MTKTVLVVAAHTDDEALGCGGTIARHAAQGDTVHAVFLADGVTSRPNASDKELKERNEAASTAHQILGITDVYMLGFPDQRTDSVPFLDIVQALEEVIQKVQPQVIYTHHCGDLNIDHRITHQAVMTACRPVPNAPVKEIYAFEVLSSTEWNTPGFSPFTPQFFVDITDYLKTKIESLDAYSLEMREPPHSRSIEGVKSLAHYRGYSIGVNAAEGFQVVRIII